MDTKQAKKTLLKNTSHLLSHTFLFSLPSNVSYLRHLLTGSLQFIPTTGPDKYQHYLSFQYLSPKHCAPEIKLWDLVLVVLLKIDSLSLIFFLP